MEVIFSIKHPALALETGGDGARLYEHRKRRVKEKSLPEKGVGHGG
ncbi:hypothetical protein MZO42_16000 [Sphingomonas psychrotolerans]|uniref:Uncharacterized protein n=1 Tax=Sphingomonas psychrotolerans TaxID=1327635 RepID=A0ABU3N6Q8_9SPHN|nr:hypothetical protein [Sphingomonas psychrotolerans]MDT8760204.1 hypothetical protein [Sphingomonas psychrotolerans]